MIGKTFRKVQTRNISTEWLQMHMFSWWPYDSKRCKSFLFFFFGMGSRLCCIGHSISWLEDFHLNFKKSSQTLQIFFDCNIHSCDNLKNAASVFCRGVVFCLPGVDNSAFQSSKMASIFLRLLGLPLLTVGRILSAFKNCTNLFISKKLLCSL